MPDNERPVIGHRVYVDDVKLDQARALMGEVYVATTNERAEHELTMAKMHLDNARAVLAGIDPDTLTHITQTEPRDA